MSTVRWFGATLEAVGAPESTTRATTVGAALDEAVAAHGATLEDVLARCSFIVDGVVTSDRGARLDPSSVLDVLPPFVGG